MQRAGVTWRLACINMQSGGAADVTVTRPPLKFRVMATSSTERVRALRARRAASIEAHPDAHLRSADELLAPAIAETIASLDLKPEDAAAARVAERYAAVIDAAKDQAYAMRWLGPLLLDALEELGATPAARAKLTKGPKRLGGTGTPNRVQALRLQHQAAKTSRGQFS
jgi:hypothetical protein